MRGIPIQLIGCHDRRYGRWISCSTHLRDARVGELYRHGTRAADPHRAGPQSLCRTGPDELTDRAEDPRACGADLQQTFRPELGCVRGALRVVELLKAAQWSSAARGAGGSRAGALVASRRSLATERVASFPPGGSGTGRAWLRDAQYPRGLRALIATLDGAFARGWVVGVVARPRAA